MAIRLIIADDHEILRIGIRASFTEASGIEVVAEAVDGVSAVSRSIELVPDVVLMDIRMPRLDGIQATKQLKASLPEVKILILTSNDNKEDIIAALSAGADGYCMKDVPGGQLILAIETVYSGCAWIDPQIARLILTCAINGQSSPPESAANSLPRKTMPSLSARELEVLGLLVEGLNNLDIGKKLTISHDTVKSHMRRILEKLEVNDRTQAAIKAMREGLV